MSCFCCSGVAARQFRPIASAVMRVEVEMGHELRFDQLLDFGLIAGLQVLVGANRAKGFLGDALDQRVRRFLRLRKRHAQHEQQRKESMRWLEA